MQFKRKIYNKILQWKEESAGKSALLIEGARRVGKSTIVSEFARKEYKSHIIIDFNKAPKAVIQLFDDLMDLDRIFIYLQTAYKTQLFPRKSVIVFDEVQTCPKARQAIKYLVEDGRFDYIETGSLISIKKHTQNITIPSEEDRLSMYPMDYEEFQWALGDDVTMQLYQQLLEKKMPLSDSLCRQKMRELRLYMLVGGMPQAVNEYITTRNLQKVDIVKRRILKLYEDDFLKIDSSGRVSTMFKSIPGSLSRNELRYKPKSIAGRMTDSVQDNLLNMLVDSKTVNAVFHADDPNVGMGLTKDFSRFKLYIGDTGLFVTLAFWDKEFTENTIYEKLLSDKLSANMGYIYENLVAQMLIAAGNELFYYTWDKDNSHKYEVDFLLSRGNKISPIEVKSSGYKSHASLDAFIQRFHERISQSFLIYTKDLKQDERTLLLPVFMTPLI